jgi:hypothetical protein
MRERDDGKLVEKTSGMFPLVSFARHVAGKEKRRHNYIVQSKRTKL